MTAFTPHAPCPGLPVPPRQTRLAALALGAAVTASLAACGGGNDDDQQFALKTTDVSVIQRAAEPQDPGARTRAARYTSRAQAEQLDAALEGDVVWLDVACCGFDGAEQSVGIAHGIHAAKSLRSDAPVFVTGADQRLAAHVANRLEAEGLTRVFLITP